MYIGDYRVGDIIYHKFTSRSSQGVPTAIVGGVIKVYQDNATTTEQNTGLTFTASFDSLTGLNQITLDTSQDATFYAAAHDYMMVITTGTVDGVSVVGEVVGRFSLENRATLAPTTKGRKLDVSTGGEAGLDWANIGSPTTVQGLSGTTVKDATDVETKLGSPAGASVSVDVAAIKAVLPAALVSGRMDSSVGAYQSGQAPLQPTTAGRTLDVAATGEAGLDFDNIKDASGSHTLTNITVPAVTTVGSVSGAVGSVTGNVGGNVVGTVASVVGNVGGNIVGNVNGNVAGSVASVVAAVTITAGSVQAIWDALTSALTTIGSIGKLLVTNIDAAISSRLASGSYTAPDNTTIGNIYTRIGAPAGASIAADLAEIESETDGIASIPTNPLLTTDSRLNNLDATISSRLASGSYTAPDNSSITAIKAKTDNLPAAPASTGDVTSVYTRIGAPAGASVSADVAAVKSDTAAVKAKTDNLPASPANQVTVAAISTAVALIPTNPLLTNDSRLNDLDAAISTRATYSVKQNTALGAFSFPMVDSSGTPLTGLTVSADRSIDGSAFASCANDVEEIGQGFYSIDLAASDLNGKIIALQFTADGAQTLNATVVTEP